MSDENSIAEDGQLVQRISEFILAAAGGKDLLQSKCSQLFRSAIDDVIDTRNTGRFRLDELEKTEKTYIGTRVEILFRNLIKAPKGCQDVQTSSSGFIVSRPSVKPFASI
ncbi:MAG: hypothetical protein FJW36_17405 [Acidobacteria bacterium]|nr:hypothetical protein [Acidobacteriota bacterium]